jgi:hypothetical protein
MTHSIWGAIFIANLVEVHQDTGVRNSAQFYLLILDLIQRDFVVVQLFDLKLNGLVFIKNGLADRVNQLINLSFDITANCELWADIKLIGWVFHVVSKLVKLLLI